MIEDRISLLDEILEDYRQVIGADHAGYKNHVYRMINFCFALRSSTDEERQKLVIAACFHDIGIWTADTFDYLPPSIDQATRYLSQHSLDKWIPEITLMIDDHHRLRKNNAAPDPLVEIFRKGDLVDFSFGVVKFGITNDFVKCVKARFPNAGFHKKLVRLAGKWVCRHPLHPVPVLKW